MTLHLTLNANQSNDMNNDPWLSTWLWMPNNQMTWIMIRDSAHDWMPTNQMTLTMISDLLMLFDWLAFHQVQSHGSLLMSFDWLTIKSMCIVTDHCSCHLIGWHSKPGAESLIIVNVIWINNDQWLCTWLWMPTNQMTLTMIYNSAPGFECQPIKMCIVTDHCSCILIGWHSKPGAESLIIVNVIWLADIQIQVQSHWSLLMSFEMISDSAPGFECQPIKWH
jgi:hypothetical protein